MFIVVAYYDEGIEEYVHIERACGCSIRKAIETLTEEDAVFKRYPTDRTKYYVSEGKYEGAFFHIRPVKFLEI